MKSQESLFSDKDEMAFLLSLTDRMPSKSVTSLGIRNVRERLEKQCGGTLVVESRRGEDTTVTVFIPAAERNEQGGDA